MQIPNSMIVIRWLAGMQICWMWLSSGKINGKGGAINFSEMPLCVWLQAYGLAMIGVRHRWLDAIFWCLPSFEYEDSRFSKNGQTQFDWEVLFAELPCNHDLCCVCTTVDIEWNCSRMTCAWMSACPTVFTHFYVGFCKLFGLQIFAPFFGRNR